MKNGTCAYVTPRGCSIYDDRPDICRVSSWKESAPICNELQESAGMDESWRVTIPDL